MLFEGDISPEVRKMVAAKVATLENTDERRYLAVGDMAGVARYVQASVRATDIVYLNGIGYPASEIRTGIFDARYFVVSQMGLTIYINKED